MAFSPEQQNVVPWRWPFPPITQLYQLGRARRDGFDLVMVHGAATLEPMYRLMKDGKVLPAGHMSPTVPRQAHVSRGYYEFGPVVPHADFPEGIHTLTLTNKAPAEWRRDGE